MGRSQNPPPSHDANRPRCRLRHIARLAAVDTCEIATAFVSKEFGGIGTAVSPRIGKRALRRPAAMDLKHPPDRRSRRMVSGRRHMHARELVANRSRLN